MQGLPIYDIWRILSEPREIAEGEIRGLCRTSYLGDHQALTRILGRYKLYVDTRDIGIASHLMLDGYWEMWVTEAMMRLLRRGAVVADVGANLGYFTVLMADLTGADGHVLSFEPNPQLAPLVRKSVEINGFAGFTRCYDCGLGAAAGWAQVEAAVDHPGGGRTLPIADNPPADEGAQDICKEVAEDALHPVPQPKGLLRTITALLSPEPLPLPDLSAETSAGETEALALGDEESPPLPGAVRICRFDELPRALEVEFMKIDVEGFEPHVWQGMTGRLENYDLPLTIFMEFTISRFAQAREFLDEILSWGFSLSIITFRDGVVSITPEALFAGPSDVDHMLVFQRAARMDEIPRSDVTEATGFSSEDEIGGS